MKIKDKSFVIGVASAILITLVTYFLLKLSFKFSAVAGVICGVIVD